MPKIDDKVLAQVVGKEISSADTWMDSDLASDQADALDYYYGEPFGNEQTGFSQVVTRDVLETVEGIMPELMKIFTSGDNFVQFDPVDANDVEGAEQATDYLNYVFQRRMNGFTILYNWFKDALLMRNGIVKTGWEKQDCVAYHWFRNVEESELEAIDTEEDITVEEKNKNDDGTYDVRVSRVKSRGQPFVENIPSEEFRIKARSKSIKDSDFVAHVTERTVGDMIEAGYKEKDLTKAVVKSKTDEGQVKEARFSKPSEEDNDSSSLPYEKSIEVIDAYVRLFDEKADRNTIYHVVQVGNTVLMSEEVESVPFISLSPIMVPHKFVGVSVVDLVKDVQEIRSQLYRQTLDNLALTNSGRYSAVDGQVNLQDLLDNKIGGVVRMKVQGAVQQLPTPMLGGATFPFLQELEREKENRVGVSKMTMGLDSNALTSNTAATAVNQVMTAAQQKILLIARVFAETGVKELFWELYRIVRENQDIADIVKLRGKFVEVNPFDWQDRMDMTVTVGIGNGNKDQQLFHLNNIQQLMQTIGNTKYDYMVTIDNVYNLAREFVSNAGYKNTEMFISDPSKLQPPEPQPSPEMVEAQAEMQKVQQAGQKAQADVANQQAQLQIKQQQLQLDMAEFEWKKKVEAAELGLEATQGRAVGIGDGK